MIKVNKHIFNVCNGCSESTALYSNVYKRCTDNCTHAVFPCFPNSVLLLLTEGTDKKIEREVICIDMASDRMRTENVT